MKRLQLLGIRKQPSARQQQYYTVYLLYTMVAVY